MVNNQYEYDMIRNFRDYNELMTKAFDATICVCHTMLHMATKNSKKHVVFSLSGSDLRKDLIPDNDHLKGYKTLTFFICKKKTLTFYS